MVSTAPSIAILSIKPIYADAIFAGEKKVEFRRRPFGRDVSHVVVYATQPVGAVIGWFEIDAIEQDTPKSLWSRYQSVGCIDKKSFHEYFEGRDLGCAIRVINPKKLKRKRTLSGATGLTHPPQSFAYLAEATAKKFREQF